MIYRLLALNIDGTLLNDNARMSKQTKEAIEYVTSKGIYVMLVTSRSFPSAKRVAKALKLNSYVVAHQGAYIANELDKPLRVSRINEDITFELVKFLERFNCHIRLLHEKYAVANKRDIDQNIVAKGFWQRATRLSHTTEFVESVSEYLIDHSVEPPKIEVLFQNQKDLDDAKKAIESMYIEVDCIESSSMKLEIVPVGTSKLKGVLYVCDRLGVPREEVVMIGSGIDDIPLIEWAGLGVAMGNANKEVKRSADWITRDAEENGVAYMVKEHFRKQHPIEFLKRMNVIKR
ncbi:Cof-type HAD-IIB family hydrolase [Falsibacillus albus]|uniref:HAD family phosphatase n=1 Tax=Falsibacillus albus TaxID=2478915 RepID=A0A3L7K5G7_9BACI|nr:Cof-type HAD-IIB family hydrolase [Falsibacillus albus]RLQ97311.1 HAD family phosphatase [Falsibacillus albus]